MKLRASVDKFCKECIYDGSSGSGTWREQVTNCTSPNCPLYPHRPVDSAEYARRKSAEIANMTPKQLSAHKRKSEAFKAKFHGENI